MKITDINNLDREEFVKLFGNIVECFSEVAYYLYSKIPFKELASFLGETEKIIDNLSEIDKKLVLRGHPDLAAKLAEGIKITEESMKEQKAAGLDKISKKIEEELHDLNRQYKEKFDFPFVICARENKIQSILNGLRSRLKNDKEQELLIGIDEVKKISKLRIRDIIEN